MDIKIVQTTFFNENSRTQYYQIFKDNELLIPYKFSSDELSEISNQIFWFFNQYENTKDNI